MSYVNAIWSHVGIIDSPSDYPCSRKEIKGRGSLFNTADYPPVSQLAKAFSRDVQYLTLSVPGNLKAVSQAVFARERARAQRSGRRAPS
jgi:hypothetical protein